MKRQNTLIRFSSFIAAVALAIITVSLYVLWLVGGDDIGQQLSEIQASSILLTRLQSSQVALTEGVQENILRNLTMQTQDLKNSLTKFSKDKNLPGIYEKTETLWRDISALNDAHSEFKKQLNSTPDSLRAIARSDFDKRFAAILTHGTTTALSIETALKIYTRSLRDEQSTQMASLKKTSWLLFLALVSGFGGIGYLTFKKLNANEKYRQESEEKFAHENVRMQTMTRFVEAIASGSYSQTVEFEEGDHLTQMMAEMKNKLQVSSESDRKRNWANEGMAEIAKLLRDSATAEILYSNVTRFVVKYTRSNQASLFVLNDENKDNIYLQLVSTYAYDKKKFAEKKFELGEGLVGQAVLEGQTVYLTQVPQQYIRITSGLGEAPPTAVIIIPLKLNDKIYGAIEMASFHPYEAYEIEFLEKLGEGIASSISTAQVNDRTRALLLQSQQQAEELKAQEEEIRQNMEELTATQEEMSRKDMEMTGQLNAINNTMAAIEFSLNGVINSANEKFLHTMGYTLDEVKGKHHRMFVDIALADSREYKKFWEDLRSGIAQIGEFQRIGKHGKSIWLSASYTPILNQHGDPYKIIKFAQDITEQKIKALDFEGQIKAVNNTMASIEFTLDGKIVTANEKFLAAMGYTLSEIKGKYHRMFADEKYTQSLEYNQFWQELNNGISQSGEFRRIGKNKKEVWLNASYTPILNINGKPYKIVKFAQDVTAIKLKSLDFEGQINAVNNTMASIEFTLDGNIVTANQKFLDTMGYTLDEIKGKHHRMFTDAAHAGSYVYHKFWEDLGKGISQSGEFRRLGKDHKEVWLSASYTPIKDIDGRPYKVIKFAQDITAVKQKTLDYEGQVNGIRRSNAVIEFDIRGNILDANEMFVAAMGYETKEQIVGRHHSIFVTDEEKQSAEYRKFWERLAHGEFFTGEFVRKRADGSDIQIRGSYNPILDSQEKPCKVIKFAQVIGQEQNILVKEAQDRLIQKLNEQETKKNRVNTHNQPDV